MVGIEVRNQAARRARSAGAVAAVVPAFLLVLASGPASSGPPLPLKEDPVPGWPRLAIETHYVSRIALRGACLPVPAGTPIPETAANSCARPDFWRGVCDIYIDVAHIMNSALREREEQRCRGHDEQDSNRFAEALNAWRERGENRYADMLDFETMTFIAEPVTCERGDAPCVQIR